MASSISIQESSWGGGNTAVQQPTMKTSICNVAIFKMSPLLYFPVKGDVVIQYIQAEWRSYVVVQLEKTIYFFEKNQN